MPDQPKRFPRRGAYLDVDSDPAPSDTPERYLGQPTISYDEIVERARELTAPGSKDRSGLPPEGAPGLYT